MAPGAGRRRSRRLNSSTHIRQVAVFRHDLLPLSETFIRDQVRSLRNWRATLVGRRLATDGLALDGIPTHVIPTSGGGPGNWRERTAFWLNRPVPALAHAFDSLGVDLVHAHFGTDATDIWPSVKAAGLPLLVTLHGYDINILRRSWRAGHGGLRRRIYPERLLGMAHDPDVAFVAVSDAIRTRAIEVGIPPGKIVVSRTGVDTQRFAPAGAPLDQRRRRIVFVGRMVENKGPVVLLRAFAIVKRAMPDAELAMVGAGPMLEAARGEAERLGLAVSFSGGASREEVLARLGEARVLCLPSVPTPDGASEGFGQVLLEAQSCGVPVVGSDTGGIPEAMQPGTTGLLFPPGDEKALAECLMLVLGWPEERLAEVSRQCRSWAKSRFDLRSMTSRLEEIYDATQENQEAGGLRP